MEIIMKERKMKKYILMFGVVALLSNCAELDKYMNVSSNATAQEKFRACALSEAQSKLKNGTLFSQDISSTKEEIVNTCLKKMALQAAGIDSEAESIASSIINSLRNN